MVETKEGTIAPNGEILLWNKFTKLFTEKFFLCVWTRKKIDFINLVQGDVSGRV